MAPFDYHELLGRIAQVLRDAKDPNAFYNPTQAPLFTHIWTRPTDCTQIGFCTDENIGQDSGDVVALMAEGYNFDGMQNPVVARLGDDVAAAAVYSVPNFYGAHGHDSTLPSMSAILYAAGPSLQRGKQLKQVHNIDVAPTVMEILGVRPAATVDGAVITKILKENQK